MRYRLVETAPPPAPLSRSVRPRDRSLRPVTDRARAPAAAVVRLAGAGPALPETVRALGGSARPRRIAHRGDRPEPLRARRRARPAAARSAALPARPALPVVLDGHRPCLDLREIARANAGAGLSLVMPLYLQREHDLGHPDSLRLRPIGPAAWYFCHAGYNRAAHPRRGLSPALRRLHGRWRIPQGRRGVRRPPATRSMAKPASRSSTSCTDLPAGMANAMSLWVMHPQAPVLGLSPSSRPVATTRCRATPTA